MKTPRYAALIRRLKASDKGGASVSMRMPRWVGLWRMREEEGSTWVYLEPKAGARTEGGQMVVDLPAGRYMIEVRDLRSGRWISRESAAGGPLVAGLPFSGGPQLLRITKRD